MKQQIRCLPFLLACLLFCAAVSTTAVAGGSQDRTQVGHDINVGPGEEIGGATCFGCSVRVRGQVSGDVTVFGGNLVVENEGQIGGDVTTFGGGVRLEQQAKVNGDLAVFGGRLRRDAGASVGGDVTNFAGAGWIVLMVVLPFIFLGGLIALIVFLIRRITRPSVPAAA